MLKEIHLIKGDTFKDMGVLIPQVNLISSCSIPRSIRGHVLIARYEVTPKQN